MPQQDEFSRYATPAKKDEKDEFAQYAAPAKGKGTGTVAGGETQFEKENKMPPWMGFTPSHLAGQAWQGLKEIGSGTAEMGKDILFPEGNTEGEKLKFLGKKYITDPSKQMQAKGEEALASSRPWWQRELEGLGYGTASNIPILGPWAASLGEQAGKGDIGGAAARGGTQVLAAKAATRLTPGIDARAVGRDVGGVVPRLTGGKPLPLENPIERPSIVRDIQEGAWQPPKPEHVVTSEQFPEGQKVPYQPAPGKLGPKTQAIARLGGMAIGGTIGRYIGGAFAPETGVGGVLGGGQVGPEFVKSVIPEPSDWVADREAYKGEIKQRAIDRRAAAAQRRSEADNEKAHKQQEAEKEAADQKLKVTQGALPWNEDPNFQRGGPQIFPGPGTPPEPITPEAVVPGAGTNEVAPNTVPGASSIPGLEKDLGAIRKTQTPGGVAPGTQPGTEPAPDKTSFPNRTIPPAANLGGEAWSSIEGEPTTPAVEIFENSMGVWMRDPVTGTTPMIPPGIVRQGRAAVESWGTARIQQEIADRKALGYTSTGGFQGQSASPAKPEQARVPGVQQPAVPVPGYSGETPAGLVHEERTGLRQGSAGDLASWTPEDLWAGYMKNRGTPFGENLALELQRRGLAASPAESVRPSAGKPPKKAGKVE